MSDTESPASQPDTRRADEGEPPTAGRRLVLYGAVIDLRDPANVLPVNTADNWLHLGLGVGMIVLGLLLAKATDEVAEERRSRRATTLGSPARGHQ